MALSLQGEMSCYRVMHAFALCKIMKLASQIELYLNYSAIMCFLPCDFPFKKLILHNHVALHTLKQVFFAWLNVCLMSILNCFSWFLSAILHRCFYIDTSIKEQCMKSVASPGVGMGGICPPVGGSAPHLPPQSGKNGKNQPCPPQKIFWCHHCMRCFKFCLVCCNYKMPKY